MIKYLGSKRTLLDWILETMRSLPNAHTAIDLFSGTSRVGHHLKKNGFQVFSNDLNSYAYCLATCYVQANLHEHVEEATKIIAELNNLPGYHGYFTETFCVQSRFFQEKNGKKIDAIRDWIEAQNFTWELKAILLVSLMEAADRVDSTCGLQMAFLKSWSPRSHNDLEMKMPEMVPQTPTGKSMAYHGDAVEIIKQLQADIAYLDPPYNQHKYLGNYHIWETLIKWDKPEFYGIACKRQDVRDHKSVFNGRKQIHDAMRSVIANTKAKYIVVSFNNEGYITKDEMIDILSSRGKVFVREKSFKRYIGAQIGIYNQDGVAVGDISHTKNLEYLFVLSTDGTDLSSVLSTLVSA